MSAVYSNNNYVSAYLLENLQVEDVRRELSLGKQLPKRTLYHIFSGEYYDQSGKLNYAEAAEKISEMINMIGIDAVCKYPCSFWREWRIRFMMCSKEYVEDEYSYDCIQHYLKHDNLCQVIYHDIPDKYSDDETDDETDDE